MRFRTPFLGRRGKAARALAYILFSALAPFGMTSHAASQQNLRIVVNAGNRGVRITRASLRAIYLDPHPRWADGTPIQAVDQPRGSHLRSAFNSVFLGMSVGAVQAHWLRQNFTTSGKAHPPQTKEDDAAVLAFVKENPNAIGYVSPDVTLDAGVKALDVVE